MKRIFAALLLLPFLALGADGSYEEGLEARRAGDYTEALNQWMLASDDPRCMTAIARQIIDAHRQLMGEKEG